MSAPVKERRAMVAGMDPLLRDGVWHFVTVPDPDLAVRLASKALASMRESEGVSLLLAADDLAAAGLTAELPMAHIELQVQSALDGVGLTAAVASVLAEAGIPCNVVAGACHDHLFVPVAEADRAVALLRARAAQEAPS